VLADERYVQHLLLQSQGGGFQELTTNKGGCGVCKIHEIFTEISTLKISESETAHPWLGCWRDCVASPLHIQNTSQLAHALD
jgi:hypothetical protein